MNLLFTGCPDKFKRWMLVAQNRNLTNDKNPNFSGHRPSVLKKWPEKVLEFRLLLTLYAYA